MEWSIQYSDSQNHVEILCVGQFTVEDFFKMKENLLASPFWQPGLNMLVDYRQTDLSTVSLEDLRFMAEKIARDNERVGGGRIAFLMSSLRDFGLGRQYEMLAETMISSSIMIFRDEALAIDWLNSKS